MSIENKIKQLRKQINYEKRKMKVCTYSSEDLKYLWGLEEELENLLAQKKVV